MPTTPKASHALTLTCDEALDAAGNCTLRWSDGTVNGAISEQPVATVYEQGDADEIMLAFNSHAALIECREALENVKHQIETDSDLDTITGAAKYRALLERARAALEAARKAGEPCGRRLCHDCEDYFSRFDEIPGKEQDAQDS